MAIYEKREFMPPYLAEIPYGFKNLWKVTAKAYDIQTKRLSVQNINAVTLNGHSVTLAQLIQLFDYNRDGCALSQSDGGAGLYITFTDYDDDAGVLSFDTIVSQELTFTGVTSVTGDMVDNADESNPVILHDTQKVDVSAYNADQAQLTARVSVSEQDISRLSNNVSGLQRDAITAVRVNGEAAPVTDNTAEITIDAATQQDLSDAVAGKVDKTVAGAGGTIEKNVSVSISDAGTLSVEKTALSLETGVTANSAQSFDLKSILGIDALEAVDTSLLYLCADSALSSLSGTVNVPLSALYRYTETGEIYTPVSTDKIRFVYAVTANYSGYNQKSGDIISAAGYVTSTTASALACSFLNLSQYRVYNQYNGYRAGQIVYDAATQALYSVRQNVPRPTTAANVIPVTNTSYYTPAVDRSIMQQRSIFANFSDQDAPGSAYSVDQTRIELMRGVLREYAGYNDFVEFKSTTIPTQILTESDWNANINLWVTDGIPFTSLSALINYTSNYTTPSRYKISNLGIVKATAAGGSLSIVPQFDARTIATLLGNTYISAPVAVSGNLPIFTTGGQLTDSGKSMAAFASAAQGAKADSAVQAVSISSGSTNGTITLTVDGDDQSAAVTGLGSAAYANSTTFASAAQGAKADSAVQAVSLTSGSTNGTVKLTVDGAEQNAAVAGLGSAAYSPASAFASAAQGAKADSAVQSVTLSTGDTSGTIKLTVDGTAQSAAVAGLGNAAYSPASAFATAAQGAKADSALQPASVVDGLNSTASGAPLSANQGRILAQRIESISASGKPIGGFANWESRYTNTSQFAADLQPISINDYIYIASDENHTDLPAQYAVSAIGGDGEITYTFTKIVPDSARDFTLNPISNAELSDGAVNTKKLAYAAVTSDKIANGAVGSLQLDSNISDALTSAQSAMQTPLVESGTGNVVASIVVDENRRMNVTRTDAVTAVSVDGSGSFLTDVSMFGGTLTAKRSGTALQSVNTSGEGNVVTSVTANGTGIDVSKGITAITGVGTATGGNTVTGLMVSGNQILPVTGTMIQSVTKSGTGNAITGVTTDASGNVMLSSGTMLASVNVTGEGNVIGSLSASGGVVTATRTSALTSVPAASTAQAGIVQLNDTLTSDSAAQALTANQGKALKTSIDANNASAVHLAGAETISGAKTFASHPSVPSKTSIPASPSATQYATEAQAATSYAKVANATAGNIVAFGTGGVLTDTGVPYTSVGSTEITGQTPTAISGILKGSGGLVTAATPGTDYTAASHTSDANAHSAIFANYATAAALGAHTGDSTIHVTAADKSAWSGKQAAITASGILKGDGAAVSAAQAGVDYAPAFSPYQTLSASVTLTAAHFGQYLLLSGASAFTVTLPAATAAMSGAEMELHNIGAGTVTLTGALQLGSTANTSASVTLETGSAVTVKCVGTGAGAWTLIGAYTEV